MIFTKANISITIHNKTHYYTCIVPDHYAGMEDFKKIIHDILYSEFETEVKDDINFFFSSSVSSLILFIANGWLGELSFNTVKYAEGTAFVSEYFLEITPEDK